MRTSDSYCLEQIKLDVQARHAARKILEVGDDANLSELKKAYRKASLKYHPDHNQDDPDAGNKFILIKCAYELLAQDRPCPTLLREIDSWHGFPDNKTHKLDNPWGHFLWWREKYFDSEKRKRKPDGKHSSCI
ncbi:MAG TPA: hypothetical protein ENI81_09310 [Phycisphaerales bacterium]|nr:hypothetical protein [Phycisphaerales bacterium]